ncbi:MAG: hypothetical protein KDC38_01760, partial [Planctomycetes bacterium]|nr:hypothetical protein [Planctomycetota bacterium]
SWQLSSPEPANRWLVVHLVFGVPTLAVAPMFVLTCTARVRSNALFRIGIATFGVSIAGAIGAVELLTEPLIPAWTPAVLSRAHAGFGIAALSSMIALIAAWRIGWRSKV